MYGDVVYIYCTWYSWSVWFTMQDHRGGGCWYCNTEVLCMLVLLRPIQYVRCWIEGGITGCKGL